MLSYALAIAVALSSLILFLTAFFMSDIHRKDDFLWSGVGLFYALVLWFCARNITGAVLLGQASASILLVSFVWQTLKLRKAIANPEKAAEINSFSVLQTATGLLKRKKKQSSATPSKSAVESPDVVTESDISIPQTTSAETKAAATKSKVSVDLKDEKGSSDKQVDNKKTDITTDANADKNLPEKPADREKVEDSNQPQLETEPALENSSTKPDNNLVKEDSPDVSTSAESTKPNSEQINEITEVNSVNSEAAKSEAAGDQIETNNEDITKSKPETVETDIPVEIESETEDKPENVATPAENSSVDATAENYDVSTTDTEPETTAVAADKNSATEPKPEATKKESPLDFLETVEVAEVLEAESESKSGMRDNDRTNIIDIEVTTEITEIDRDSQSEEN
ncbi:MAG: Ycf66 family protein [Cyanobacteria bacterium P01_G01_bin.19]